MLKMLRVAAILLSLLLVGSSWADLQGSVQTPKIKTEQKSEKAPTNQNNSKDNKKLFISPADTSNPDTKNTAQQNESGNKKGTEFWPAFYGYRLKVTDSLLVLFTIILTAFTGLLYRMARKQDAAIKTIERAYVKLSHIRPGIEFSDEVGFFAKVEVKNWGNTPANVIDVLLKPVVLNNGELLPKKPNYSRARSEFDYHAFLVSGEGFTYWNPEVFRLDTADVPCIKDGSRVLYLIGYVDYTDRFGIEYRAGYARRYWPRADQETNFELFANRNNLFFVTQEGYNYDRKRT